MEAVKIVRIVSYVTAGIALSGLYSASSLHLGLLAFSAVLYFVAEKII